MKKGIIAAVSALFLLAVIIVLIVWQSKPKLQNNKENNLQIITKTTTVTTTTTTATTTTTTTDFEDIGNLVSTFTLPKNETIEEVNGCLLADKGTPQVRAMEKYYYNSENNARYAKVLDSMYDKLDGKVNVWSMLVPTSQAYYDITDYESKITDQKSGTKQTFSNFKNAKGVNVYDVLSRHKTEEIYSRTDYHWQPLGAYYAAGEFAKEADVPFCNLKDYKKEKRTGYVGAFSTVNKISALDDFPENFTYFKPKNLGSCTFTYYDTAFENPKDGNLFFDDMPISASYTCFVGRDDIILECKTSAKTGRTLAIFKDSYGNALVPFLLSSFDKIYLCDYRYFKPAGSEFIKQVNATDVLFCTSTSAMNSNEKVSQLEILN